MQRTYEGYIENGEFYAIERPLRTPGRRRAFITILDEPPRNNETMGRVAALDEFFAIIEASGEEIPETFERITLKEREV